MARTIHARAILDVVAARPEGTRRIELPVAVPALSASDRATLLPWLLDVLTADGYIVADGDRVRFVSPILRRYWAARGGPTG